VLNRTREVLLDYLRDYDAVVEVAIGRNSEIATVLTDAGVAVTATDVHEQDVPDDVAFVRDDILDPEPSVYADADAIYALNLPPELHRPTWDIARAHDAAFLFTTLGQDQPTNVPVTRESIPSDTLYVSATD
jgi:hypothetical protein